MKWFNIFQGNISLYSTDIDYEALEEKINSMVIKKFNINWLPGSIAYYEKPLERMQNSKINISYYKEQDEIALSEGTIDNSEGKTLRLTKI